MTVVAVSFERVGDERLRFLRTVRWPDGVEERGEIAIPPDLVADEPAPFEVRLRELPAERFADRGREVCELLLGSEGPKRLWTHLRAPGRARIEIWESPEAEEATAVPWEMAYDGRRHLATWTRLELVRRPVDAPRLEEVRWSRPLRMLIFWAEPKAEGVGSIGIEREQISLGLALAGPRNRGEVEPIELVKASRDRLREALATRQYDVLYFSGHGTVRDGVGYLALEGQRSIDLVSAVELENMVALQPRPPALVFLNCCVSGRSGAGQGWFLDLGRRLLDLGVAHVVATIDAITVRSSREWMEAFFRTLVVGGERDVGRAIVVARSTLAASTNPVTAQSFYQFMHLAAVARDAVVVGEEEPQPATVGRSHVANIGERVTSERRVRRNGLQLQAEEAFLRGSRVVGLYAAGGLGKTVFTVQLEEMLLRHPDDRLRVGNALWVDLRGDASHAAVVRQLATMLEQAGARPHARWLRDSMKPDPGDLAHRLAEVFGPEALLTFDNVEDALGGDGAFSDGELGRLLQGLATLTRWRVVFAARERFDFRIAGRDPCPIEWIQVPALTEGERAALLELFENDLGTSFESQEEVLIVAEVARHPYELSLFLQDTDGGSVAERVARVREKTAAYARLDYYLGRTSADGRQVLRLLALTAEPLGREDLEALWMSCLEESAGEGEDAPGRFHRALVDLRGRGLIETVGEEVFSTLPVVASRLLEPDRPHGLELSAKDALTVRVAVGFDRLAHVEEAGIQEAGGGAEPRGDAEVRRTYLRRRRWRRLAARLALDPTELGQAWSLTEQYLLVADSEPISSRRHFADRLLERAQQAEGGDDANRGIAFGVVGGALAGLRSWDAALLAYEGALRHLQASGRGAALGVTHHQIGMVWQEQREWSKALAAYGEALRWNERSGQEHLLGSTHHQIGMVWQEQREWSKALAAYSEALRWNERSGREHLLGSTHHQIGMVWQAQRDWPKALAAYDEALQWKRRSGQEHDLGSTHHQIGMVWQAQRDWPKALAAYDEALRWKRRSGQEHALGLTHYQIGRAWSDQREWAKALAAYEEALRCDQRSGQEHELGWTHHQIGRVWEEQRAWPEAFSAFSRALRSLLAAPAAQYPPAHVLRSCRRLLAAAKDPALDEAYSRLLAEHPELQLLDDVLASGEGDADAD